MRLFLSGLTATLDDVGAARDAGGPPLLISFWEVQQNKPGPAAVVREWPTPCFLDSGAFSAKNSGAKIDLDAFVDFYLAHASRFEAVANLDVIGDPRASARNLATLHARGVPALPVWHITSSLTELDALAREHPRFAIGGMVPYTRKRGLRDLLLARAWDVVHRHWPRRVHGFGITSRALLVQHPWWGVDSTTALQRTMHGELFVDGGSPQVVRAARRSLLAANARVLTHVASEVTEHWRQRGVVW